MQRTAQLAGIVAAAALLAACPVRRAAEVVSAQDQARELIAQFDGEGMAEQVRARAAMQKVVKIGAPAVPQLVTATSHQSPWVRLWSLAALCSIHDPAAVEPALRLMEDPHPTVRMIAVWHGSGFATEDARLAPAAIARMSDANSDVRGWARRAIIERHLPGAEPALAKLLDHEDDAIRLDAFVTLALLRRRDLLESAVETIRANPPPRRLATALDALGRGRPDKAKADFYLAALDHADPLARDAGVRGLEWILKEGGKPPDAAAARRGPAPLTEEDLRRIQEALDKRLPPLLKDAYAPLRAHALYLLAAGRREALLPEMEAAVRDAEPVVRAHAYRALARAGIKDKRTLAPALRALDDPDATVRDWAWKAVQWVTDGRVPVRFVPAAPEATRQTQAEHTRKACAALLN